MNQDLIKIQAAKDVVEIRVSASQMMFNSFLSGLAWGVGSVIGATVIVALIFFLVGKLNTAPLIGKYISSIINYIQATNFK